jgi:hypothetical protein
MKIIFDPDNYSDEYVRPLSKKIDFFNIKKLEKLLIKKNIPFVKGRIQDGHRIVFPTCENWKYCIACHSSSLGGKFGLLELEEESGDKVIGYLDYKKVYKIIKEYRDSY